jgi:2'-5' RNA ligase
MEEAVRSFIAIELPDELKRELSALIDRLRADSPDVARWIDPAGIHLTLKFLGDVPAGRLDSLTAALTKAVAGFGPFRLEVGDLGVFPESRRVRVVWVAVSGETGRLQKLQQAVEGAMEGLGFPVESRAFRPHLTLARVRDRARPEEREAIGQLVAASPFRVATPLEVSTVHLMRSRLAPGGVVYSRSGSVPLTGP